MSHPPIQIVDEHDNPVGSADMEEAQREGLHHRIVRVMLENERGEVLLQKRAKTMATYPGCWDNSAAGHVDAGEDYVQAATREMREEIGVDAPIEMVEIYYTSDERDERTFNRFNGIFKGELSKDSQFDLQEDEVTEVKWVDVDELKTLVRSQPQRVSDGLKDVVERYYL